MKSTAVKCSAGKAWFNAVQVLTLLPLFVDRDDVQGWPCKLIEKEERLQLPLCFKGSEKLCTLWSVGELMNLGHLDLPKSIWLEGRDRDTDGSSGGSRGTVGRRDRPRGGDVG